MNLDLFRKNFDNLVSKNRLYAATVVVLLVIVLMQEWTIATQSTRMVIVPPYLDKAAKVGFSSADKDYYESFGLYVAELVGNLTPGSAPYVAKALGKLFGPGSYNIVKGKVLASAAEEKADGANFSFTAHRTIWQPATSTVFVEGHLHQINSSGVEVENIPYTFEMRVHIEAGQPVLSSFTDYPGPAHTIAWLLRHQTSKKKGSSS